MNQSITPMAECKHPWKEIQSIHEFGELYEQCNLCKHVITSRLIKKEILAFSEAVDKGVIGDGLKDSAHNMNAHREREIMRIAQRQALKQVTDKFIEGKDSE